MAPSLVIILTVSVFARFAYGVGSASSASAGGHGALMRTEPFAASVAAVPPPQVQGRLADRAVVQAAEAAKAGGDASTAHHVVIEILPGGGSSALYDFEARTVAEQVPEPVGESGYGDPLYQGGYHAPEQIAPEKVSPTIPTLKPASVPSATPAPAPLPTKNVPSQNSKTVSGPLGPAAPAVKTPKVAVVPLANVTDEYPSRPVDVPLPASPRGRHPRHGHRANHLADEDMYKLAEGVGSLTYDHSPSGNTKLNHELRRRLEVQDCATFAILLAVFAATIAVSCFGVYRVSEDPSPVAFYSDSKINHNRLLCGSMNADAFLQTFNTQPRTARLHITGRRLEYGELGELLRAGRFGDFFHQVKLRCMSCCQPRPRIGRAAWDPILFDVYLDLTPFISGDGRLASEADAVALEKYISSSNPLELLVLRKQVVWNGWEDVASNVRQRFRTLGFEGKVDVEFQASEEITIYRNHHWQNFVRNRITQFLIVMSVVGFVFWVPYLCIRGRKVKVETRFQMTLDIARYWELLSQGLNVTDGFSERT